MAYPDGGAVLDQPLLLLDAFSVIGTAKYELSKKDEA
jgi:hypothetical protein